MSGACCKSRVSPCLRACGWVVAHTLACWLFVFSFAVSVGLSSCHVFLHLPFITPFRCSVFSVLSLDPSVSPLPSWLPLVGFCMLYLSCCAPMSFACFSFPFLVSLAKLSLFVFLLCLCVPLFVPLCCLLLLLPLHFFRFLLRLLHLLPQRLSISERKKRTRNNKSGI